MQSTDFDVLPIAVLRIDPTYQRDLRDRVVKDMLEEGYDLNAANTITVSERPPTDGMRDPRYYIVDGQHRTRTAEMSGETEVLCKIIRFNGSEAKIRQQEAHLRGLMGHRKADTPIERFKHQLAAGSDESLKIDSLVESYGGTIAVTQGRKGIQAISTLEKLYRKQTLNSVLRIIKRSWDTFDGRAGEAAMFEAIHWFVTKHDNKFHEAHFIKRLAGMTPDAVHARAAAIQAAMAGSLWKNYYRAIVESYNIRPPRNWDKLVPIDF